MSVCLCVYLCVCIYVCNAMQCIAMPCNVYNVCMYVCIHQKYIGMAYTWSAAGNPPTWGYFSWPLLIGRGGKSPCVIGKSSIKQTNNKQID